MAAPVGPKKVHRCTLEFKIQAVRLASQPDIRTQDVANALRVPKSDPEKRSLKRQVKQLEAKVAARREVRALERKLAALEVEHDLLEKAIRLISNVEGKVRIHSRAPGVVRRCVPVPALQGL